MAAVVMRTFSSSSTTSTRGRRAERWPLALVAPTSLSVLLSGIRVRERRRIDGEDDVEGRAHALLACRLDSPAVVANDVLRDPEPEPRALGARREERLEDAREVGLADAAPRVADLDGDGRLERLLVDGGEHRHAPALLHRLLRVQEQVEEDLTELVGARPHLREPFVEAASDLDPRLLHLLLDEDQRLLDELVDLDPLDLARAAGEAQHLADDVRDALGLLARDFEEAPVLLHVLARREQVERVLDGFERVVDLVRDGGGEAADRGQLLRLEELLLDTTPLKLAYLREVVEHRDDGRHLTLRVRHLGRRDLHRERARRLGVNEFYLGLPPRLRARGERRDERGELDRVVAHGAQRALGHLVALLKEQFRPLVKEDELARGVADGDGLADVFEYQVEAVALAPRLGFGLLELDEVARQLL